MAKVKLALILAASQNGAIGKDNKLLWHIPEDLAHFKKLTASHAVIMGRKTYDSILGYLGRPLPGRQSIVLTSQPDFTTAQGVFVTDDLQTALQEAQIYADAQGQERVFCIGGGSVYEAYLPLAEEIFLTKVHDDFAADSYFDLSALGNFTENTEFTQSFEDNTPPFSFHHYEKV